MSVVTKSAIWAAQKHHVCKTEFANLFYYADQYLFAFVLLPFIRAPFFLFLLFYLLLLSTQRDFAQVSSMLD
jgi:hypothetical protein